MKPTIVCVILSVLLSYIILGLMVFYIVHTQKQNNLMLQDQINSISNDISDINDTLKQWELTD